MERRLSSAQDQTQNQSQVPVSEVCFEIFGAKSEIGPKTDPQILQVIPFCFSPWNPWACFGSGPGQGFERGPQHASRNSLQDPIKAKMLRTCFSEIKYQTLSEKEASYKSQEVLRVISKTNFRFLYHFQNLKKKEYWKRRRLGMVLDLRAVVANTYAYVYTIRRGRSLVAHGIV